MGCCSSVEEDDRQNVKVRGCTDIIWLSIYIALWIFMILTAAFAFVYGNPKRLVHGYDSFGNTCGSQNKEKMGNLSLNGLDMTEKPYVFFLDVRNVKQSLQICVEACPNRLINNLEELRLYYKETGIDLCRYDFNVLEQNSEDLVHGLNESLTLSSPLGPCPKFPVYKSIPVLNRCIPSGVVTSVHNLLKNWDFAEQFLADIYASWHIITGLCVGALIASLVMVSLFYILAGVVGYIILLAVSTLAIIGTFALWWTFIDMPDTLNPALPELEQTVSNRRAFLIYAIIATVITVIVLLLVYSLKSKVSFLVTLFKESAECLSALPALYLQPIFTFIQLMIFYAFWISVIVCLASARYPGTEEVRPFSYSDLTETPVTASPILSSGFKFGLPQPITNITVHTIKTFTRVEFKEEPWVRSMWWLYLIGLVWVSEFILGCQQMVIAGAVATWYFNGQRVSGRCPVGTSVKRIACYHLGSVAFGSLLITICKIPRLILSFFYEKKGGRNENEDSKSCVCCGPKGCICCSYCFEKFIRYMNHNAYTVVAMQGIDFFPAASRAWTILTSDPLKVVTYNSIGDLVLFLGKALITALTGSVALLVFKSQTDLHFYAAPILLVCIFSFFISHCVISVYEIVIDTLYLCICEDQDINGDNGVWMNSKLSNVKCSVTEMSPINTNQITM